MGKSPLRRPIAGGTYNGVRPERYDYWRVGYGSRELFSLEFWVERAGEFHCKPDYTTGDFHWTHSVQLFYHLAGEAVFEVPGQRVTVAPGNLFVIPAQQPFDYGGRGLRYHWLAVGGVWPAILGDAPAPRHLPLEYDSEIEAKFIEIRELLILQKHGYPLKAVGVFYELMARIEEVSHSFTVTPSTYPDIVCNAMNYLIETYDQPFDAAKTAAMVNVSQSYLRSLFDKWLGESPRRFHTRYRIDQAKRILHGQRLQISEVASQVGFDDTHYFSRVFKRVTGISPSQYVKEQVCG